MKLQEQLIQGENGSFFCHLEMHDKKEKQLELSRQPLLCLKVEQ
jgi:hypothetical protein